MDQQDIMLLRFFAQYPNMYISEEKITNELNAYFNAGMEFYNRLNALCSKKFLDENKVKGYHFIKRMQYKITDAGLKVISPYINKQDKQEEYKKLVEENLSLYDELKKFQAKLAKIQISKVQAKILYAIAGAITGSLLTFIIMNGKAIISFLSKLHF